MKLRLVVRSAGAAETGESEVVLTAEPETTVGELASAIAGDSDTPLTLAVVRDDDVVSLPPDLRLADDLLAQGTTVRVIESAGLAALSDAVGTLTLLSGEWEHAGRAFPLFRNVTTIGADPSNHVVIVDAEAGSRRVGVFVGATIEIFDRDSGAGVEVDGDVVERVRVNGSATLTIGRTEILVTDDRTSGALSTGPVQMFRPPRVVPRFAPRRFPAPEDEESLARATAAIERRIGEQRSAADAEWAGPDAIVTQIFDRGSLVWTRRPEHDTFGSLRVGVGSAPRADELTVPPSTDRGIGRLWEELDERTAVVADMPLPVSLRDAGSLGVVGSVDAAAPVVRSLMMQLGGLYSPEQVTICAVIGKNRVGELEWLKWLPHTWPEYGPLGEDPRLATGRLAADALLSRLETWEGDEDSFTVLLVAEDSPVDRARVLRLAERSTPGVHVIWLSESLATTPGSCRAVIDVVDGTLIDVRGGTRIPASFDTLSVSDALRASKALAGMRDAGGAHRAVAPPTHVSLVDLIGREAAESPPVIEGRWESSRRRHSSYSPVTAVVGSTGDRPLSLTDSGVTIVGGTTGSGKTTLIRTWLASLAATYPPDRVGFLLIELHGGAAFSPFDRLPHTVAHVTELTPHGEGRLLRLLRAHIRRQSDTERWLPYRLFIVVDEATTLQDDHPALVTELTRIAGHVYSRMSLVIGAQRPALLPEEVRRIARTKVALRTADADDSRALIASDRAAEIPPAAPGRAIRLSRGRIDEFQTAYCDDSGTAGRPLARATVSDFGFGNERRRGTTEDDARAYAPGDADSDADLLGAGIAAAFAANPTAPGIRIPDELSRRYDLLHLPVAHDDRRICLGMREDPEDATQDLAEFMPDEHRHLAIVGPRRSGKSTALRTLALSAAFTRDGAPVEVYAVGAELEDLALLEHVGSVIDGDDGYGVRRLLTALRARIREREEACRAEAMPDYLRLRDRVGDLPVSVRSRILLLLDSPRILSELTQAPSDDRDAQLLRTILRAGPALGVHVIVSGAETLLRGDLSSLIPSVLELGASRWNTAPDSPDATTPGRGLWAGHEVQVAVVADADAVPGLAAAQARAGVARPPAVGVAPEPLRVTDLAPAERDRVTLGLSLDDLAPVSFERTGWLKVSGPLAPERATAMNLVAQALDRAEDPRPRVLLKGSRSRSALVRPDLWHTIATSVEEIAPLLDDAGENPPVLFVESTTLPTSVHDLIETVLSRPPFEDLTERTLVVFDHDSDQGFRIPFSRYTRTERGIVLSPRSLDLSRLRDMRRLAPPAGSRAAAYWVDDGEALPLLLPLLEQVPHEQPPPRMGIAPSVPDHLYDTIVLTLVVSTGERYPLGWTTIVGRRPEAEPILDGPPPRLVRVPSPQHDVSRSHVEIRRTGSGLEARDLATRNGTRLLRAGRAPVRIPSETPTVLRRGDVLDIGDDVLLSFEGTEVLWRDARSDLDGDVAADALAEA